MNCLYLTMFLLLCDEVYKMTTTSKQILLLLSTSVIASSFNTGLAMGLINNNINRRINKSREKHMANTATCIAPNPNPYAPENLQDKTKCYPEDEPYKPSFIVIFATVLSCVLLIKTFCLDTAIHRDFFFGIVVAELLDVIINDD